MPLTVILKFVMPLYITPPCCIVPESHVILPRNSEEMSLATRPKHLIKFKWRQDLIEYALNVSCFVFFFWSLSV
jgi:hypothetical protein